MDSYDFVELLKKRSRAFLKYSQEAFNRGDYDLACFFAEQAAQLRLKSLILRILGMVPRTHRIRELLGTILKALRNLNYEQAETVNSFINESRSTLRVLEDAYTGSRYLERTYDKDDAFDCINLVKELFKLLERVERNVFA